MTRALKRLGGGSKKPGVPFRCREREAYRTGRMCRERGYGALAREITRLPKGEVKQGETAEREHNGASQPRKS